MINWYKVFYWLTVANNVKDFFDWFSNIFTVFWVILLIILVTILFAGQDSSGGTPWADQEGSSWKYWMKMIRGSWIFCTIIALTMWAGYIFTPSKKDCLLIIAGGAVGQFITSDSSAKALPSDLTKFLHISLQKELSGVTLETKKELGMISPKEEFLEKAKKMSKEELIKYLESDSTR